MKNVKNREEAIGKINRTHKAYYICLYTFFAFVLITFIPMIIILTNGYDFEYSNGVMIREFFNMIPPKILGIGLSYVIGYGLLSFSCWRINEKVSKIMKKFNINERELD